MGYYMDQLAEQDRQKRLADLLAMQQDNSEPGVQYDTPQQPIPQQGSLSDLMNSGASRDQINAMLSQSTITSPGFDAAGTTGRGKPYMPPEPGYVPAGMVEQAPLNSIRNNTTGVVTDLSKFSRPQHDVYRDGPQVMQKMQNPDGTYDQIVKKATTDGFGRQSTILVRETVTPDYLNPAMIAKDKMDKARAELAQIGAKPVAVYGADGKTPEFVSPKDAIGRKPYTASIAGQGEFTPEALRTIAEQYLAGDRQAAQGYARNASAKMAIANEINKVAAEKGMGGADIAAVMADYQGMTAGSRVLGGRTANIQLAAGEAAQMIPLALEASKNVARAGFLPFGKAQIMFDDQTNDPALREFAAANNALVNTYARAISPAGVPTVHDKEHARQILSTAHDQKSYEATVLQMQKEMDAALAAPGKVREKMREGISGKTLASSTSSPVATDRGAVIEQNGVQYMVMSRNADGSAVIKDPKTGKTGVWRP